jgi:hypothetical protein
MLPADRRQDQRFPVYREGLLSNFTKRSTATMAIIGDLCQDGCFAESAQEFQVDDAIELSIAGKIYLGEIVHSRRENANWFVGIKFEHRLDEADLYRIATQFADIGAGFGMAPLRRTDLPSSMPAESLRE